MNHTICYVSQLSTGFTEEDINAVFETTQLNNCRKGITGILLYGFGNFFQVLEGDKKEINELYNTIIEDRRHHNIETLINHDINFPIFAGYSSSFNVVKTKSDLTAIKKYLDFFNTKTPFSSKITRLINPFLYAP
ncbi:FAD-dependent sensor of blue light [Ulvibacter sp. MAR_2010_11]|uniref:BLUF domain-containing protein n=1 Tax=Ulvibacter sp. MAR_2010_11 TaxID=1250229 RepID=UPI000CA96B1A|nr:BLUF domain-containing protein [Ulvibacter sp. MAR_2010_11]PKA82341.1 FAD-dependent sensor of blue light [Ulvibacter sp. MAR_2010_11]